MTAAPDGAGGAAPQARFDDLHRVLGLFAQALADRPLRLLPQGGPVTATRLAPRPAEADIVRLPPAIDGFGTPREASGAYRIAVLRELARLDDAPGGPDRHPAAAARPRLHARVAATLERLRVDASIGRDYPGARADLERVLRGTLAQYAGTPPVGPVRRLLDGLARDTLGDDRAALLARDPTGLQARLLAAADAVRAPGATPQDSARAARTVCALLASLGAARPARAAGSRTPVADGTAPAPGPRVPGAPDGRAGAGGAQDGDEPCDTAATDDPDRAAAGFPTSPPWRAQASGSDGRPAASSGAPAAPHASGAPAASTAGAPGTPGTPGAADAARADAGRPDGAPPAARPAAPRRPAAAGPHSVLHDEWDFIGRRYLAAWCRVNEHRLRGDAFDFIADVRRRHPDLARRIRSRFALARPRDRRRMPRVVDGDDLDLESLVEGIVDRRAGHGAEPRPYLRRDPLERTVAAAFLVDMSASTGLPLPEPVASAGAGPPAPDPAPARGMDLRGTASDDRGALLYGLYDEDLTDPGPRAPRRRVIDVAKDALALMSDALAGLGDAHAIYGFSGNGRHDVEFHVAKDFTDAVSPASWAAIAAIEPRGSTRMGAAIRHAAARLARQPAGRRLLMVVSDGYPQDVDYGPDRGDETYGIQDTARALQEAARAGLATFCVTIDPAGHDYLRAMCPDRQYMVIDDVEALPAALAKVYLGLTDRG